MEKWVPVALVVVLLVGSGGGYFAASSTFTPKITTLEGQLTTAQQQLTDKTKAYDTLNTNYQALSQEKAALDASKAALQSSYDSLQSSYASLQSDKATLQTQYNTLSDEYDTLRSGVDSGFSKLSSDYVDLKRAYDALALTQSNNVYGTPGDTQMLNNLYTLTLAVRKLNSTLWEYCNEATSFRNTLTTSEVLKVESTVRGVVGSSTDAWSSYQKIHEYITSNVKYVYDIEFPYIGAYHYIDVNGVRYLTSFDVSAIDNYVQTPEFTLKYKQGDCDDQGALEYAMVRYYNKYILGSDYNLYLAQMDFSDGSGHIAVFMPVQGGKMTILDPAGNYLTKSGSTIASNAASSELETYNNHWVNQNGSITNIQLYSINLTDGSYTVVAHGTRAQIASFLGG